MKREKVKRRVSLEFKVLYPFFAVPSSSISGKLAGCPQERCSRHCAREACLRFDYEEAAERKWFIRSPNRARPTPLLLRLLIRSMGWGAHRRRRRRRRRPSPPLLHRLKPTLLSVATRPLESRDVSFFGLSLLESRLKTYMLADYCAPKGEEKKVR